ncbi:MAG: DNA polymerase domain-containing protein, partial [Rhodospirillales bacterium]
GWQETFDEELKGAIIMDPEEMGTIGLHKNVCILDFAGLYPSVMVAYNTSWETKVKEGEERDDDIIGDGCRFRRSPEGVLPKCVKELDVLRDHYKALRQEVANTEGKGSDNYRKWDDAQKTVKRLRATFYGLMGYGRKGYAWGDLDIAKTITYGGRTALLRIQEESEKLGYEVIYGHTDSIFVKLGDEKSIEECAKEAQELGKILTKICQEEVQSDALVVEPEMIMDRFYLPRRNKYAGRIVWQPGTGATPFDIGERPVDSRIKMQGMEAKATNTSKVGKTVQLDAIKMIWDGAKPQEVLAHLKKLIADVKSGAIPVENLVAGASIGQWLPSKKILASQPKMIEVNVTDEDGNNLMEPVTDEEGNIVYKKNGQPKMVAVKESIDATAVHYGEGATNLSARPNPADDSDKCYLSLSGDKKGAAWHNIVLANDVYAKMDKGDSYGFLFVKDGPTWIPEGGYVAFHDLSQIKDYTIDIDTIIEKNIIGKLDYVLSGIGLSNSMLREKGEFEGKDLTIEDFQ